ncbi:MAG: hypothetical protein WCV43_04625 [Candidatus Caldatribacteriota bacterium]|jgi:Tfp pilus assembly protein PilO|nr:hypothetical protein [Atribacterota bacterium]MDD3641259.1 hypothetical protein [Atribacterota bacterium]MDD4289635.1 hypothetical protein [Atribacterota bacterium]MDI9597384.1 hypothetical protein [Atribacterota bacterium]
MAIQEMIIVVLIIALIITILGFLFMLKRYNYLKEENNKLKYFVLKFRNTTNNKKQRLDEYQSIIDKMKSKFKDKN